MPQDLSADLPADLRDAAAYMHAQDPHAMGNLYTAAAKTIEAQAAEIARLTAERDKLKTVMIAAAEEIAAHWDAHCDAEGYGPVNLQRRLEEGIPSEYGYTAGAFAALRAERDGLRVDAERLDWLRNNLFEHKWNGVIGKGCAVQWQVAPDFRFKQRELTDTSGILAGDFRRAIDAAREST